MYFVHIHHMLCIFIYMYKGSLPKNIFPILICILVTNGALHPTGSPVPDGQVTMAAVWEMPLCFWVARFQQRASLSVWFVIARCLLMKKRKEKNW